MHRSADVQLRDREMGLCALCNVEPKRRSRNRVQSYCVKCHAADIRSFRETHPLTADQRFKMHARAYAKVYLSRGKLQRKPCQSCGSPDSQMHHADYSKPLGVEWLCRVCHLDFHYSQRT